MIIRISKSAEMQHYRRSKVSEIIRQKTVLKSSILLLPVTLPALALLYSEEIYVVFQMKLSEECSSLQAAVNLQKCKLESCHKKLEASEQEVEELRCQAMEYCNALEVIMYDISDYATVVYVMRKF